MDGLDAVVEQLEVAEDGLLRWFEENPRRMHLPDMPDLLRHVALIIAAARVVRRRLVADADASDKEES